MANLAESLPLYIRIVEGLKETILNGQIKEEEQLPSTTYISNQYNINIATVNKAINILVDEGLAYKKRGIGMFVKKGAVKQLINERRETFKERYIKATIIEARRIHVTPEEIQEMVKEISAEMDK
jgi:DNA-binding transcriptional regulator YhcF (GntR family)